MLLVQRKPSGLTTQRAKNAAVIILSFLRRYLVIELKDTEFMPEYIGKLNFYCSAVDDILCCEEDNRTIGLLLCKTKDRIKAEYVLRDIQKQIGISDYELGFAERFPGQSAYG